MRVLDLFCGGGGAAKGYLDYDCKVDGIDNVIQPNYPGKFWQADALVYLALCADLAKDGVSLRFDFIHASPPCKGFTRAMNIRRDAAEQKEKHLDLVTPTRVLLKQLGIPYVIENVVPGILENPIMLCGTMFGLPLLRHRYFECSFPIVAPLHPKHEGTVNDGTYMGVYGMGGAMKIQGSNERRKGSRATADWRRAMGMPWATRYQLTQAIPPAYTRYIMEQFLLTQPA